MYISRFLPIEFVLVSDIVTSTQLLYPGTFQLVRMILKAVYLFVAAATIIHQTESAQGLTDIIYDSNGIFSNYLYSNLSATNQGSLLLSPASLNYALTAISLGTGGNSLTQLRTVLNQHDAEGSIISSYQNFAKTVNDGNTLKLITKMYLDKQFHVKDQFQNDLNHGFQAGIENVDFANYPEDARQTINKYVKNVTLETIKELFQPGLINEKTKALVVNSVYFSSPWRNPFAESDTQNRPFHAPDSEYQVEMMFKAAGSYKYANNNEIDAQIIELPYSGDYSLLVILPHDRNGIADVENKIKAKAGPFSHSPFIDVFRDATWEEIDVFLPKFKFHQYFELKETLKTMGIKDIFNEKANFTKLSDTKVQFSDVIQKALFSVDEAGTLAATGGGPANKPNVPLVASLHSDTPVRTQFNANHPFLYVLKLGASNTPLFIGKYLKP